MTRRVGGLGPAVTDVEQRAVSAERDGVHTPDGWERGPARVGRAGSVSRRQVVSRSHAQERRLEGGGVIGKRSGSQANSDYDGLRTRSLPVLGDDIM